jgi:O-acetylhomoserine/O-acetylserine sulfhydrylase-like pyridoxal-dependent enzyme
MIWAETPSNPLLKVTDLHEVAKIGKERGILTVVDNTFASPWLQRPLEIGADLVVHSVTKYINGHSDMVGGVVVVRERQDLAEKLEFMQNATGSILDPFSSFFLARSKNAAVAHAAALRQRDAPGELARGTAKIERVVIQACQTIATPACRQAMNASSAR